MTTTKRLLGLIIGGMLVLGMSYLSLAQSTLAAPTNLVITNLNQSGLTATWQDNASDEDLYSIERSEDGGLTWGNTRYLSANTTTSGEYSLTCGQSYSYRVRAYRYSDMSYSDYSNVASGSSNCSINAPTNLQSTAITAETISLGWTDNANNESYYLIQRRLLGTEIWNSAGNSQTSTSFTDNFPQSCGASFEYRVRAYSSTLLSYSAYSNVISLDSGEPCSLNAPSNFHVTASTIRSVSFQWDNLSLNATSYEFDYSNDGGLSWPRYTWVSGSGCAGSGCPPPTPVNYTRSYLSCGTTYHFRARYLNSYASVYSDYTPTLSATTSACLVAQPTGLTLDTSTPSTASLSWTDNASNETAYYIERIVNDTWIEEDFEPAAANTETYNAVDLDCETDYRFRVRAYDSVSNSFSQYSNEILLRTADCTVNDLAAGYSQQSRVTLSWSDVYNYETAFFVERSSNGGTTWTEIAELAANSTSYNDEALTCGTTYDYRIRAYDSVAESYSNYSNVASVTINCTVAAPRYLYTNESTHVGSDSVTMDWEYDANNEIAFRIERSEDAGLTWQELGEAPPNPDSPYNHFFDAALNCTSSYQYRVRAYNLTSGDYSPYSNIIEATTDPCIEQAASAICSLHPLDIDITLYDPQFSYLSGDGTRLAVLDEPDDSVWLDGFKLNLLDTTTGELLAIIPSITPQLELSDNGQQIVFASRSNYTGQNADETLEFFLWDEGVYTQLTNSSIEVYFDRIFPHISGNGSTITFSYQANLLTNTATPGQYYHYVWRESTSLQLLTNIPSQYSNPGFNIAITDDGTSVIFSHEGNLTGEDPNHNGMLYRKNLNSDGISSVSLTLRPFGFIAINADASRIAATGNVVTSQNPDGNEEVFLWDSAQGWRQITEAPNDATELFFSMDDSGYRLSIFSGKDLTGENPADPNNPQSTEYTLYNEGIGFSQITNHNTQNFYQFGRTISDDGTRQAFLLYSGNKDAAFPHTPYLNVLYITDCPPPPAPEPVYLAPSSLQAASEDSNVNLQWLDNANNETNYIIERSSNGGTTWTEIAELASNSTSYSDEAPTCGTSYQYRVRVYDSVLDNYSDYSNTADATVDCPPPSAPDTSLAAPSSLNNERLSNSVLLTWQDNETSETNYLIERSSNGGSTWTEIAQVATNSTTYSDTSYVCNTYFSYRIRAYKAANSYSDYQSFPLSVVFPCQSLTEVSFWISSPSNVNYLTFNWTDKPDETEYVIYRSGMPPDNGLGISGQTWVEIARLSANTTTYTETNLPCQTSYYYSIRQYRSADKGYSFGNSWKSWTYNCPSDSPILSQNFASSTEVGLTWNDLAANETNYIVERSTNQGLSFSTVVTLPANTTTYTHSNLACSTQYLYRVRAYNSNTNTYSNYSNAVIGHTWYCDTPFPTAPSGWTLTSPNPYAIRLTWIDMANDETEYRIYRKSGSNNQQIGTTVANTTEFIHSGLTCNTSYSYLIRTYRAGDHTLSQNSTYATVTTSPCPISKPTNLRTDANNWLSSTFVGLSWNDNSNNETAFLLERSEDTGLTWTQIASYPTVGGVKFDESVACDTPYKYRVRAYNGSTGDYSPYSNILEVTTQDCFEIPESSICTLDKLETAAAQNHPQFTLLSGDGSRVAVVGNALISGNDNYGAYIFDTTTGAVLGTIPSLAPMLDISDDGKKIVFASGANHTGQNADNNLEIFLWNDGTISQITNTTLAIGWDEIFPKISGNGATILFSYPANLFTNTATPDLYYHYIWRQATGLQFLTNVPSTLAYIGWNSAISDNGNLIIFPHEGNLTGQDPTNEGMLYRKTLSTNVISGIADSSVGGFLAMNADGSRIATINNEVTSQNPDGNLEYFLWDATRGWRQISEASDAVWIPFVWMDDTGNRLLLYSGKDLTGENPYLSYPSLPSYIFGEYFLYDDGLGFSQLTNHDTPYTYQYGASLSDNGRRAAFLLNTVNRDISPNPPSHYARLFIADCPPPPAASSVVIAPYDLEGDADTSSIQLHWEDASSNETAFVMERSRDGDTWQSLATLGANIESYNDTGLVCAATYDYRVRAFSSTLNKYSPYSIPISVTTESCALSSPDNLHVTATTSDSISLAWTDTSSTETAILLERSPNGTNWQQIASLAANSTSYTDSPLACGTSYSYRLRNFDTTSSSYSIYTPLVIGATATCPPLATSTLSIVEQRNFEVDLAWTAVAYTTSYDVYEVGSGGALTLLSSLSSGTTAYTVDNLACYSSHSYTVIARRSSDNAFSRSNDVSMSVTACPTAPTGFAATPSVSSIGLAWTDNANNETAYEIQRKIGSGEWTTLASLPANSTNHNDANLKCQMNHSYRLRAYRSDTGAYSPWLTLDTATLSCPPLVASSLSSTGSSANSLSLDWTVDTTATTFTLWHNNGFQWSNLGNFNEIDHSFTHNGLACASSQQYRLQTYRQQDNATVYSAIFAASTAACAPLLAPAAPTVLNADTALVTLQIPALPSGASSLRLERSSDGSTWQALGTASGSYIDTTVACASSYHYRLVAQAGAAESAPSPVVNATTLTCPTAILSMVGLYKDGQWRFSNTSNLNFNLSFGDGSGWKPLTGDWDGDGVDGIGLYRAGRFILRNDMNDTGDDIHANMGDAQGWQGIAGDWDGDGVDSIGIYRNGIFILSNDNQSEAYRLNLGTGDSSYLPVAGDWDGNGADTIGLYRMGQWLLSNSVQDGQISHRLTFGPGSTDWYPIAGDWNGDGVDGIAVYGFGSWRFRETVSDTANERALLFGDSSAAWLPIASSPFTPTTPPETIPVLEDDDDSDGLSNGDEAYLHGTDPQDADSDDDGLSDGEEIILHESNPLSADSDGDLLSDSDEVNLYDSNPNNSNSDSDSCVGVDAQTHRLDDYFESKSFYAQGHEDADGDGIYNSMELDADADLLDDCLEAYYYATNPYNANTDGDDLNDYSEIRLDCRDPNDSLDSGDTCGADSDSDMDGYSDYDEVAGVNFTSTINGTAINLMVYLDPLNPDTDNDGLGDREEILDYGSHPLLADSDGDGLVDGQEVSLYNSDPRDSDTDNDGLIDKIEAEGIFNYTMTIESVTVTVNLPGQSSEAGIKLLILNADSDADGWNDGDEVNTHHTNPLVVDTDGDGLMDSTDPYPLLGSSGVDSDGDGLPDTWESNFYTPITQYNNMSDPDNDSCNNQCEYTQQLDPLEPDTDNDGLMDGAETTTDPLNSDTDNDYLSDGDEVNVYLTNPVLADTDGDGMGDGAELMMGCRNPLNAADAAITDCSTAPTAVISHNCLNLVCDFSGSGSSDPDNAIVSYVWNFGDPSSGMNTATGVSTSHTFSAIGSYTVSLTVTDSGGMSNTATKFLMVPPNAAPIANFVSNCTELTCTFISTSADSDGTITSFVWSFSDSTIATGSNPSKTFAMPGNYMVTLTVTDNRGTSSNVTKSVSVNLTTSLDSDGDGLHDAWEDDYYTPITLHNGESDPDADSCNNSCEFNRRLDPMDPDTDNDGLLDGQEINTSGTDPDTDDDGLLDGQEVNGINLVTTINGAQVMQLVQTNPLLPDTDSDGLNDYQEVITHKTFPANADSDGDGVSDGQEVNINGTDPRNAN